MAKSSIMNALVSDSLMPGGFMDSRINYLRIRAAEERSEAWSANDVEASRIHLLSAEYYEAQALALSQQQRSNDPEGLAA